MPQYPAAVQRPCGYDGGAYTAGPFRIVLHTTEGSSAAGALAIFAKHYAPHFLVDAHTVYQLLDTSRAGTAMRHPGPPETNRLSAIQIEMVGFAGKPKDRAMLARVRDLCRWLEETHDIPRDWPNGPCRPAVNGKDPGHHNRNPEVWTSHGGYYGHEHVPGNCVAADTPILCSDLHWRAAGDLRVGNELLAFDEESTEAWGRKFCASTVIQNRVIPDALLLVNTPVGSVRCNHGHPWLARRRSNNDTVRNRWVRACDLTPEDEVWWFGSPWQAERSWEAGWLAGMFDGEGSLSVVPGKTVQLSAAQRESETADRLVQALVARSLGAAAVKRPGASLERADMVQVQINSRWEALRVLGSIRPPRLLARARPAWDGGSANRSRSLVPIESIEDAGTGAVASLETSSRTYIAAGFAMHNTHWDPALTADETDFLMGEEPSSLASRARTPGTPSMPWWGWALIGLAGAAILGLGAYAWFMLHLMVSLNH